MTVTISNVVIDQVAANHKVAGIKVVELARDVLLHDFSNDGDAFTLYTVNAFKHSPRVQKALIAIINKTTPLKLVSAKDVAKKNIKGEYILVKKAIIVTPRELNTECLHPSDLGENEYNSAFLNDDLLWGGASVLDWGKIEAVKVEKSDAEKANEKMIRDLQKELKSSLILGNDLSDAVKTVLLENIKKALGL